MNATAYRATIARTVQRYGEDVDLHYAGGDVAGPVRASVQASNGVDTVNDYQQDAMLVYVPASALAVAPAKMDRVAVRGIERTIDFVRLERMDDLPICWVLVIR